MDQEALLGLTPRAEAILRAAASLASSLGYYKVGVEHVMLAILGDPYSVAYQALALCIDPDVVRQKLQLIIKSEPYNTGSNTNAS